MEKSAPGVDASPSGAFCLLDPDGRLLAASAALASMCGAPSPAALVGRPLGSLLADAGAVPFPQLARGPWSACVECRRDDGGSFASILSIDAVRDSSGAVTHLVALFADPAPERAAAETHVSEERLQQAIRVSEIGIFDHDHATNVIFWTASQRRNYGWGPDEEVTIPKFLEQVHVDDRGEIARAVQMAHDPEGDGLFDVDHRIIRRDGELRWHSTRSQTFFEGEGADRHPVRTVGAVLDITERKRQEREREQLIEELELRNAELERFSYTVSHDLRSPLITVRGFIGLLERDAGNGDHEAVRRHIERIVGATDRMQALLRDLLELSRVGRVANAPQAVAFREIAEEAVAGVEARLEARGVALEIADDLPRVFVDRARLVEVVQNLVENAVKFLGDREDPTIQIAARSGDSDEHVTLCVRDNGVGIAPQHREKVFGLFEKLDAESEGTGVGLALVKRIVEVHRGRVWVESEEGEGTAVFFTLPAGDAENL